MVAVAVVVNEAWTLNAALSVPAKREKRAWEPVGTVSMVRVGKRATTRRMVDVVCEDESKGERVLAVANSSQTAAIPAAPPANPSSPLTLPPRPAAELSCYYSRGAVVGRRSHVLSL